MPYESRTGAVLFARSLDRVAAFYSAVLGLNEANRDDDHILLESPGFQLVVHRLTDAQPSLSRIREAAARHGGAMEAADMEWLFNGVTVCDGLDPEGNVIQFREQRG